MAEKRLDLKLGASGAAQVEAEMQRAERATLSTMKALKRSIGEESTFGQTMMMLRGGGAAAGIAALGSQMQRFTQAAVDARDALADGSKSVSEMLGDLGRSLPIFGGIYAAGENIRELFTGEKAAIARIEADAARANKMIDIIEAGRKAAQQSDDGWKKMMQGFRDERAMMATPTYQRPGLQATFQARDRGASIAERAAKEQEETAARFNAAIAERTRAASEVKIPTLIAYMGGGGEGDLGGGETNQADVDAAKNRQAAILAERNRLIKERDDELARIEANRAKAQLELDATTFAKRIELAKDFFGDVGSELAKGFEKQQESALDAAKEAWRKRPKPVKLADWEEPDRPEFRFAGFAEDRTSGALAAARERSDFEPQIRLAQQQVSLLTRVLDESARLRWTMEQFVAEQRAGDQTETGGGGSIFGTYS